MMADARSDLLAQHAARLFHEGKAHTLAAAIQLAVHQTGWTLAPRPSQNLVRRHVQALTMQSIGDQAYRQRVADFSNTCLRLLELLENWQPRLLGRAAKGHIDAGVTIYIRIYTTDRIGAIARHLVDHRCEEPQFATADSPRFGRFDRVQFEFDSFPVIITRCPPHMIDRLDGLDLFTGKPIATLTLDQLRRKIAQSQNESGNC